MNYLDTRLGNLSRTGPYVQSLGQFNTLAELTAGHPANNYLPQTMAYCLDTGLMMSNGTTWVTLGAIPGDSELMVATYAAARLVSGAATGDRLYVLGRTSQSDGGQGLFTWVAGGTTTINDGSQLTAPGGIWQRTPDQLYTPQIFGAVGDGVTDDTAAIQRAITGLANGQTLTCLPNSTYAIGAVGIHFTSLSNLDVNFNGAHFVSLATSTQNDGVGGFVAILFTTCINCKVHGGNFDGKTFKGGFIALTGCTDCEIYGNYSTNVGNTSGYQFGSNNCTRTRWHDNVAASPQAGGTGVRGFWLGNSNIGFIDTDTICGPNNKAISNTATGFVFQAAGAQVFGSYALNNAGSGFISSTATGTQSVDHNFVSNTAIGNTFHGYQTDVTSNVPVLRVTLSGNRFQGNAQAGMYLNSAQFFSVTGNLCKGNDTAATPIGEIVILGTATAPSSNISITGNTILPNTNANDSGVQLSASVTDSLTDITISGNNITCPANTNGFGVGANTANSSTFARIAITGNVLSTCATGISIRATAAGDTYNDVVVSGNTLNNMGTFGIRVTGTNAGQITNLRLTGNSGALSLDANTTPTVNTGNAWNGNTGLTVLSQTGIPVGLVPSGFMQADGTFIIGQAPSSSATATFSATSGAGVTMTMSAATLLGTAADVGRVLTILDTTYKYATITAATSTTVATVTLTGTLSGVGPFANNTIWLSGSTSVSTATQNTTAFSVPLPRVYPAGYFFFPTSSPVGTVGTNVLYVIMASTTVGQVYNNQLPTNTQPIIIAAPTAFSGLTPAAYTQTTSPVNVITMTIPANFMGLNGSVRTKVILTVPDTAGQKSFVPALQSSNVSGATTTNANLAMVAEASWTNQGVANGQVGAFTSTPAPSNSASLFSYAAINTAVATPVSIGLRSSGTTDFNICESHRIWVEPN